MKKHIVFTLIFLLGITSCSYISKETTVDTKTAPWVTIQTPSDSVSITEGKYEVKAIALTDGSENWETIEVSKNGESIFTIEPIDGLWSFHEIVWNLLFVDYGTSAGQRTMRIFDVDSSKQIFETQYAWETLIDGTIFTYSTPLEKTPDATLCANFEEIKAMWGGISYNQKKSYNLETGELRDIESPFCAYTE